MDCAIQALICTQCGSSAEKGAIFCKNCRATLLPPTPLIPSSVAPDLRQPPIRKRILRGVVKTIAVAAGLVFIFDNRVSGVAGILLLVSIAVLLLCLFVWRVFDLGEDVWFWPKKSDF
jgi:hypothetical protein